MTASESKLRSCRAVLKYAKDKIELYREAHGPDYVGGIEYTALIKRIEEVLNDER